MHVWRPSQGWLSSFRKSKIRDPEKHPPGVIRGHHFFPVGIELQIPDPRIYGNRPGKKGSLVLHLDDFLEVLAPQGDRGGRAGEYHRQVDGPGRRCSVLKKQYAVVRTPAPGEPLPVLFQIVKSSPP